MVIEIVAGRLVARHVGSNLYTWTSVIAVVLAGLSLGNFVGGRVADRSDEDTVRANLAGLLSFAAVMALSILWLHGWVFGYIAGLGWSWPMRILAGVTVTFLAPSIVLGTVSPVVAKWALELGSSIGRTVGSVYAWGSMGAIAGTLLTGFVLVAHLGTSVVIGLVALVLASLALAVRPGRRELVTLALVVIALLVAASPSALPGIGWLQPHSDEHGPDVVYFAESSYQSILIREFRDGLRVVIIDDLVHGYVNPDDPLHLEYEYLQIYAALVANRLGHTPSITTLHLGGGAYTFPRFLRAVQPSGAVIVAEIDEAVTLANQRATGLADPLPFTVIHSDARHVVTDMAASGDKVEAVFSDAFHDVAVPYHLATREFLRQVDRILSDQGFFAANVIDVFASGRLLGAFVTTMRTVFPHVSVIATRPPQDDGERDTFVVVGSREPLDLVSAEQFAHDAGYAFHSFTEADYRQLRRRAGPLILTDEYAPVDNLVATWPGTR